MEEEEDEDEEAERQESIDSICQMLGKNQRRKARTILETGKIPFQRKSLRVMYGQNMGSHILGEFVNYMTARRVLVQQHYLYYRLAAVYTVTTIYPKEDETTTRLATVSRTSPVQGSNSEIVLQYKKTKENEKN